MAALTIAVHNGSTVHRGHNIRQKSITSKQSHIDNNRINDNIIYVDENIREAYIRLFGQAQEEYNNKQQRADRQIKNYYAQIKNDTMKHLAYECIVQIGDNKSVGLDGKLAAQSKIALEKYVRQWPDRNPHLALIGAYLHADETEGTVHLHCDYIPVATGYKRGMVVQNGLDRAFRQQGFTMKKARTPQMQWQESERVALAGYARELGMNITLDHEANEKRKHEDTPAYKRRKDMEAKLDSEIASKQNLVNMMNAIDERVQERLSNIPAEKNKLFKKESVIKITTKEYKDQILELEILRNQRDEAVRERYKAQQSYKALYNQYAHDLDKAKHSQDKTIIKLQQVISDLKEKLKILVNNYKWLDDLDKDEIDNLKSECLYRKEVRLAEEYINRTGEDLEKIWRSRSFNILGDMKKRKMEQFEMAAQYNLPVPQPSEFEKDIKFIYYSQDELYKQTNPKPSLDINYEPER